MYEQILLTGGSQLAVRCLDVLNTSCTLPVQHWNTDTTKKPEIMEKLQAVSIPTLVFSIMNPYIFTENVIANPNLKIINLHHGILPGHRGRNAQAWAIFYEEPEAGVTWHFVDTGIDTGTVLKIERVPIEDKDTALSLMQKQNRLVPESLKSLLPVLLSGEIPIEQTRHHPDYFHLNCDIPGDGILDLNWSGHKISCFLRSMDFGILKILGTPSLRWENSLWSFKSYRIEKTKHPVCFSITRSGQDILIQKDNYLITLCKAAVRSANRLCP